MAVIFGEFHGMSSQSHLPHCKVLPPVEFNVMIPELRVTLQGDTQLWDHDIKFARWQHPAIWQLLWDDMPCNSAQRPPYWNSTSGFDFDHITAVDMSFCTSLRNFIQIGPPSGEKMTTRLFPRWRISAILDFRGPIMSSLKTHVRLSIGRQQTPQLFFQFLIKSHFCILTSRSKMEDLRHLGLQESNNGFFEKPMYDCLQIVNRYHSSELFSF